MEKSFWDEKFDKEEYIYGTAPNAFFAEKLLSIEHSGKLLLPGEGEGRNAVFAARSGWQAIACDLSYIGRKKARALAEKYDVSLRYDLCSVAEMPYAKESMDAVGLFYIHVMEGIRSKFHKDVQTILKPGGHLILEFFHKEQLGRNSGGPKTEDMLYTVEQLQEEFPKIEFSELKKEKVQLSEGAHHKGEAVVIRGFGVKK
ncbi:MAG TPA: methyltransferase domain-containing protein [Saprospiraceae bacterium]|nr:methyltransferase domain-containing protein [Saprospiraceae bacterium]